MNVPKVRRDGLCRVCRQPRPFTPQKGVPYEAYLEDPFCSGACARKWFGTTLKNTAPGSPANRGKGIKIRKLTKPPKYA